MNMELSLKYVHSDDLVSDSHAIIEAARHQAYMAVNTAMVERNWLLGKRIAEEELKGKDRATYGGEIIKGLEQDSVVSFFLYLDSVFKYKHKLVHNQAPV